MNEAYLAGVSEQARLASEGSLGGAQIEDRASTMRPGVVVAVSSGVYTVAVLAANGTVAMTVEGVTAWGGGEFELDAAVWVVWVGARPMPFLLAGGSGGGGGEVTEYLYTPALSFLSAG